MDETYSLMEFLQALASNTGLRDRFTHDPQAALHSCGLDHLSPADVHDALVLVEDNQTADFSRDYDTAPGAIHLPPPPADHAFATPAQAHHAAVSYLNSYVTSNYVVDHDTVVDHSVNQQIDTGGGHFDRWVDVDSAVGSGDGAVSAGGDLRGSTVATGDHDQVGDGPGDHDTSAFGSGTAAGTHATVGDGGAFASGGGPAVDLSDHAQHHVDTTWTGDAVRGPFTDPDDHGVDGSGDTHVDGTHEPFDDDGDGHPVADDGQHHTGDVGLH